MAKLRNPLRLIRRQEVSRKFLAVFTALSLVFQNGALFFSPTFASDGAPDEVEGLTHWFNQDGLEYNDNELISEWTDLSPSGDNAEQGTESLRPTYKANQINGLAAVQFPDGGFSYLQHSNAIGCSFHLFIVHKNTANNFPLYGSSSFYAYDISFDKWDDRKLLVSEVPNNPISETFTKDTGDWIISEVSSINTDLTRFYEDGTARGTATAVQCLNFWVARIGQDVYGTAAGGGLIAEIVQYGAPLSAEDRQGVVGWLGDKYGIDVPSYCGDGTTDPGEQCDDGNTQSGDGCSATCQTEPGTITVRKDVDESGSNNEWYYDVTSWTWDINGSGDHQTDSGNPQTVTPGTYTVSEDQKPDYHVLDLTCGTQSYGATESAQINVSPGQNVTCIFQNARDVGYINVVKNLNPTNDPGLFNLQIDGNIRKANAGHLDATGWVRVFTGSHSVSEIGGTSTNLSDYDSSVICDNGQSGSGTSLDITVNKDNRITCTFTNTKLGSIGDFIWADTDGDKVQDAGEAGIAGVTVNLYRDDGDGIFEPEGDDASASPLATTITDASGFYLFSNLLPGKYWVDVDNSTLPAGLVTTTANDPLLVSLSAGADEKGADFGYKKKGEVLAATTVLAATGASPSVLVFDLVMLGIGLFLRIYSKRLRRRTTKA